MKALLITISMFSVAFSASCDLRSGTAKEEMEKFSGTPTPTISITPTPTPIDPADIVQVDPTLDGDILSVNGPNQKKVLACDKYNQVMINSSQSVVTISGVCRKIVVNGDTNHITADAAAEFVFNGTDNTLKYARLANGKRPLVTQNQLGNDIEKIAYGTYKNAGSRNKN